MRFSFPLISSPAPWYSLTKTFAKANRFRILAIVFEDKWASSSGGSHLQDEHCPIDRCQHSLCRQKPMGNDMASVSKQYKQTGKHQTGKRLEYDGPYIALVFPSRFL